MSTAVVVAQSSQAAEPEWIWGTADDGENATTGMFEFHKTFELDKPQSARIEIVCDDRYALRLNGRLVGASDNPRQIDRYDVTRLLAQGRNRIDVRCINHGGAAGLAARLHFQSSGQEPQTLVTDPSWRARFVLGGRWRPKTQHDVEWIAAVPLGALGKTAPWGNDLARGPWIEVLPHRTPGPASEFELRDNDRVVFVGSTLIERAGRYGYLETALTARYPRQRVTFRNVGWSADTVFGEARARFARQEDGLMNLEESVAALKPTVIVIGYGANEAFGGKDRLARFREGLDYLVDTLGGTGARLVLLSPPRHEDLGSPLPSPREHNANILLYRDVVAQVAKRNGAQFVDLAKALPNRGLTDNGMHLTQYGYWRVGLTTLESLKVPRPKWHVAIDASGSVRHAEGTKLTSVQSRDGGLSFTALDKTLPLVAAPRGKEFNPSQTTNLRIMSVTGLASGMYQLKIDGQAIVTASDREWTKGMSLSSGPEFDQAESLRRRICKKNALYFRRWRPHNETYLYLFRKQEQGNNAAEVLQFDRRVEEEEQQILQLRTPLAHKFSLTKVDRP